MSKPTKQQMTDTREGVLRSLFLVRENLDLLTSRLGTHRNKELDMAWAEIESFIAVAFRVFAKTNTSKLRSETTNIELAARLSGRVVFDPD